MPNISEITINTDHFSFIRQSKIDEIIESISGDKMTVFFEDIEKVLIEESTNGGLDEYSLNIGGEAPLLAETKRILDAINQLKTDIGTIITNMETAADEHKKLEHKKYQTLLNQKILEVQASINEVNTKINNTNQVNAFFAGYYAQRENYQSRLDNYESKKNWSIGEAGELV